MMTSLVDEPEKGVTKTNLRQFVWDSIGVIVLWCEIMVEVEDRVQLDLE